MDDLYTGRQIAIFADAHSLLEPLEAALEDIKSRGITEIYSLGDNIGVGPNPSEVIDLLDRYGVISIAGNNEEYITLGIEPFFSYFTALKEKSTLWTKSKLNEKQIGKIELFPHSIELLVGDKKISLCHFANDVRIDFGRRSTWTYQENLKDNKPAYEQFLFTNSVNQKDRINYIISRYGKDNPMVKGYVSSLEDPLFKGHKVDMFDAIIQGHVHFKLYEETDKTKFYTIRALGLGYDEDHIDTASYVILKEKKNNKGFDLEEILVKYDREKMEASILNCDMPDTNIIKKYTLMDKKSR